MSSIREQIVAQAATLLNTGRPAGVPALTRTRVDEPRAASELPTMSLYQGDEEVNPMREGERNEPVVRGPLKKRVVPLKVEACAAGSGDVTPDQACDPILVWAEKALCATGAFKGLANYMDVRGITFEYVRGEVPFCRATLIVTAEYQTKTDDPESRH